MTVTTNQRTVIRFLATGIGKDRSMNDVARECKLAPDALEGRVKLRAEDLQRLKSTTKVCILFGSYITAKEKPGDLDVLFILEKTNFEAYKQSLAKAKDLIPIKIQDVI